MTGRIRPERSAQHDQSVDVDVWVAGRADDHEP
jgi:hypothetical protein